MDDYKVEKESFLEKNKFLIIFSGVFIILAILIVIIFFGMKMINNSKALPQRKEELKNEQPIIDTKKEDPSLPIGGDNSEILKNGTSSNEKIKAEEKVFGDFYKKREENFSVLADEYSLPMNVKIDVANFYDFSRKINLDQGIDSLNKNGFTIVSNPFPEEADNFYSAYDFLSKKDLPLLVTGDFLIYYYQNSLKLIFKDIEASVFYENLWEINKKLYQNAQLRYENEKANIGVSNDVYLEGARRELAFFAVVLSLLSPTAEQIEKDSGLDKKEGFSQSEANEFSFQLPAYLKNDVLAEVELIRKAEDLAKSPVLLFWKDYKDFLVPNEYLENARLKNFYLASLWLNSVFPLYYKNDNCENCLLDKDDWRISMCSAFLLSEDFSSDQLLQNKWAKIYKIMSFFKGLRKDLDYLYYKNVFEENFGQEKTVKDIFSMPKEQIDENLEKLRFSLEKFDFLKIEGSFDKESASSTPVLGLKILSENYWPNDYIFNSLTYPEVGAYIGGKNNLNTAINNTYCILGKEPNRCFGFGFDIIGLIHGVDPEKSQYVKENIYYENYNIKMDGLKKDINLFSDYNWHNNNFWSTLDIARKILKSDRSSKYIFARNDDWDKRILNEALGTWVNLQTPADQTIPYNQESLTGLNQINFKNQFTDLFYVEPDLTLIRELIANIEMIYSMFDILKVGEHKNTSMTDLANIKNNLEKIEIIIKKQLSKEIVSEDEYKFIEDFLREYIVKEKGEKKIVFQFQKIRELMVESVDGVKLLIVAHKKGDKNYFAVGPVFNYWEKKDY